jgi:hypothetical protein
MPPDRTCRHLGRRQPAVPRNGSRGTGIGRPSRRRGGSGNRSASTSITRSTDCASSRVSPLAPPPPPVLVNSSSDEEESEGERATSDRWEPAVPPSQAPRGRTRDRPSRRAQRRPPPDRRWRCQRALRRHWQALWRHPRALEEAEAGLLQLEVSSVPFHMLSIL